MASSHKPFFNHKWTKTMNTRTDQADSDRQLEVQANLSKSVAETLGVTDDELETIKAYVAICTKRIKAAPAVLFTAEAETVIRKKFPNNTKAIETVDQTKIYDEALKYIEDSAFGFPVGNLRTPAPIDKAKTDFAAASVRVIASPADPDRELSYAKALRWLAKMRVQQAFKDVLSPIFEVVHHERRGFRYEKADETVNAMSADDTLKSLMA